MGDYPSCDIVEIDSSGEKLSANLLEQVTSTLGRKRSASSWGKQRNLHTARAEDLGFGAIDDEIDVSF